MAKLELDGFDDLLDAFARIGEVPVTSAESWLVGAC